MELPPRDRERDGTHTLGETVSMVDGHQRHAAPLVVSADEDVPGMPVRIGQAYVQHADLVDLLNREGAGVPCPRSSRSS